MQRGGHHALLALLLLAHATAALAQLPEPISHTLRFPEPQSHYVGVETVVPTGGAPEIEVMMAVWTPGSYLVREYARNLELLTARSASGAALAVENSRKNRWRIASEGAATVVISYRLYCREMSVRTNWVDDDFALINGAPTFLTLAGDLAQPHHVRLELPPAWSRSVTALPATPDGEPHSYRAPDFDTLLDSPIVVGNPTVHEFTVANRDHVLVNIGESAFWDEERAAADVKRIVQTQYQLWGFLPYDRFLFLNLLTETAGGIEHKDSMVVMTSRWQMRDRRRYLSWLTTVSHELFHAWNVKRLRLVELGPFDYENEVHTRSLWVAEGLTVYYAALAVHRAGLSSREEYLTALSSQIEQLQTAPGQLVQTVEQASYDAWIKYYRQNENSPNSTISYYTKGGVIGFFLDAKIRRATGGANSLDDVMRLAYERFSGERGFTPAQFRATTEEVAGTDVDPWFEAALETVDELDYTEALDWFGLALSYPEASQDGDGDAPGPAWLGLVTRVGDGGLLVAQVPRETPVYAAGFSVGDEILAVDDHRVNANSWAQRLQVYRAGEGARVLVARRDRLTELSVTFGIARATAWELSVVPSPTEEEETPTRPMARVVLVSRVRNTWTFGRRCIPLGAALGSFTAGSNMPNILALCALQWPTATSTQRALGV